MLRVPPLLGLISIVGLACGPDESDAPWLTAPNRTTHAPFFPIDSGLHAGPAGETCHGDTDSFADVNCIACHAHNQAETDPLHVGLDGYEYTGLACYGCHPKGEVETFEGHELIFPIADGTPHGDVRCSDCHLDVADRTRVTCVDCHAHEQPDMDAAHGLIADYRYATDACRSCHPDGSVSVSREAHEPYFPIASTSSHFETGCADCHVDPADRLVLDCTDCHAHTPSEVANDHTRVGGYALDAASCLLCHPASTVYDVGQHQPFRIDSRSDHKPERAGCLDCHTGRILERSFPAADFGSLDCSECHSRSEMDQRHREEPGYEYTPQTCIQSGCHPTGGGD